MRYLYIAFILLVFLLLLGFAMKNADIVELEYYLGYVWRAPLSLMLLVTFFIGMVAGVISCVTPLIQQRRKIMALQRELKNQQNIKLD